MFKRLPGNEKTKRHTDEGNGAAHDGLDAFGHSVVYQIDSNMALLNRRIRKCKKNNDYLHQRNQFFSAQNAFAEKYPQQHVEGRNKNHEQESPFCPGIK